MLYSYYQNQGSFMEDDTGKDNKIIFHKFAGLIFY